MIALVWEYDTMHLTPDHRLAVLLHQGFQGAYGKTGISLLRYSQAEVVVIIDQDTAGQSLYALTGIDRPIPIVASVREALAYQPTALAIGIAPSGGVLPDPWWQEVKQAVYAGLSLVNGLHTLMGQDPELQERLQPGQWIWDIRQEPLGLSVGSGLARQLSCRRVLTVGMDMAIGKMSTSLELHRLSEENGFRSKFIATGQTGVMIAGDGIPLDAVRVDFASGAVEQQILLAGNAYDIVHIEGQGSLFNPASTATLPLLRGSQPTHLVLVHRAGQTHSRGFPHVPLPPLSEAIQIYESVASAGGAFYPSPVVGIALNTAHLDHLQAQQALEQGMAETGLPCCDPIRWGADSLLGRILST